MVSIHSDIMVSIHKAHVCFEFKTVFMKLGIPLLLERSIDRQTMIILTWVFGKDFFKNP